MNQKEVSELRRRWKPEKNAVSRIYGCFVNAAKEIVADLDESLGTMPEEEAELYLSALRKTLSGALGKNLIDVVFSTRQVMDSEEHRLLTALRSSQLKDGEARNTFYQKVIHSLDMGESNYLILLAHDTYDFAEEVFPYILCAVCPLKLRKPELTYFPGENEFHAASSQFAAPPELGFLFPAFDDRSANLYNALFYARNPDQIHQEFIDAVFHTDPPIPPSEQKELFETALSEALEEACSVEVVQAVHERLADRIARHKESRDPEPLSLTAGDMSAILLDCGVSPEQAQAFQDRCGQQFGEGAVLAPANLIDAGHFRLKTAQATVSVAPEDSYVVETRVIDGKKYILIPAGEDVEVNGLAVRFSGAQEPEA